MLSRCAATDALTDDWAQPCAAREIMTVAKSNRIIGLPMGCLVGIRQAKTAGVPSRLRARV